MLYLSRQISISVIASWDWVSHAHEHELEEFHNVRILSMPANTPYSYALTTQFYASPGSHCVGAQLLLNAIPRSSHDSESSLSFVASHNSSHQHATPKQKAPLVHHDSNNITVHLLIPNCELVELCVLYVCMYVCLWWGFFHMPPYFVQLRDTCVAGGFHTC